MSLKNPGDELHRLRRQAASDMRGFLQRKLEELKESEQAGLRSEDQDAVEEQAASDEPIKSGLGDDTTASTDGGATDDLDSLLAGLETDDHPAVSASDDGDLDALLAGLDDDTNASTDGGASDDLDSLLAGLETDEDHAVSASDDGDLDALLAGLDDDTTASTDGGATDDLDSLLAGLETNDHPAVSASDDGDLDALLAGLDDDTTASTDGGATDDLDSLLAGLETNDHPAVSASDDGDLDALLASLKTETPASPQGSSQLDLEGGGYGDKLENGYAEADAELDDLLASLDGPSGLDSESNLGSVLSKKSEDALPGFAYPNSPGLDEEDDLLDAAGAGDSSLDDVPPWEKARPGQGTFHRVNDASEYDPSAPFDQTRGDGESFRVDQVSYGNADSDAPTGEQAPSPQAPDTPGELGQGWQLPGNSPLRGPVFDSYGDSYEPPASATPPEPEKVERTPEAKPDPKPAPKPESGKTDVSSALEEMRQRLLKRRKKGDS